MERNQKRIRIVYLMTSCRKSGPTQVMLNIIRNLDRKKFDPILITIYEEGTDSRIAEFLPYVSAHNLIKTKKKNIFLNRNNDLKWNWKDWPPTSFIQPEFFLIMQLQGSPRRNK